MKINVKRSCLGYFVLLLCSVLSINLAVADISNPDYTEHYQVYNNSSIPIYNLRINDWLGANPTTGLNWNDPVVYQDLLNPEDYTPHSPSLGGLVSWYSMYHGGLNTPNHWNIQYSLDKEKPQCYVMVPDKLYTNDQCSLTSDDIFGGSTSLVHIRDDGIVIISTPGSGRNCRLDLTYTTACN